MKYHSYLQMNFNLEETWINLNHFQKCHLYETVYASQGILSHYLKCPAFLPTLILVNKCHPNSLGIPPDAISLLINKYSISSNIFMFLIFTQGWPIGEILQLDSQYVTLSESLESFRPQFPHYKVRDVVCLTCRSLALQGPVIHCLCILSLVFPQPSDLFLLLFKALLGHSLQLSHTTLILNYILAKDLSCQVL